MIFVKLRNKCRAEVLMANKLILDLDILGIQNKDHVTMRMQYIVCYIEIIFFKNKSLENMHLLFERGIFPIRERSRAD